MEIKKNLIPYNQYSRPMRNLKELKGLVIHWIGVSQSKASVIRNNFANAYGVYASTHYIIDYDTGEIIQAIPENEVAFHVGSNSYTPFWKSFGLGNPNNYLVGIECCINKNTGKIPDDYSIKGKYPELGKPSEVQYKNLVEFCADFLKRNKLTVDNLYRHYDITGKACHIYFYNHDDEWDKFKRDVVNKMSETPDWKKEIYEKAMKAGVITDPAWKDKLNEKIEVWSVLAMILNAFGK